MIHTRSPTSFCANLGAVEDRSVNRDELSVEIDRAVIAPCRDHVTDHATGAQPSDACSSAAAETPARAHRPAQPLSRQLFLRITFETVPPGSTGQGLTGAGTVLNVRLFQDFKQHVHAGSGRASTHIDAAAAGWRAFHLHTGRRAC